MVRHCCCLALSTPITGQQWAPFWQGASIVLSNPVSATTAIGPGDLVSVPELVLVLVLVLLLLLLLQLWCAAINIVETAD